MRAPALTENELYHFSASREYCEARVHLMRALRHANLKEVNDWLIVCERLLSIHAKLDHLRTDGDRRDAFRKEKNIK
jgi:hypothetical protein